MSVVRATCVECGSAGSVRRGFCEVCYAETGERGPESGSADLPPAALAPARVGAQGPLRFRDVVDELNAIAELAGSVEDSEMLAAACRRAERLIQSLRGQFLADLGLYDAHGRPNGSASLAVR